MGTSRVTATSLRNGAIALLVIAAVVLAVWHPELALRGKGGTRGIPDWAVCCFAAAAWTAYVLWYGSSPGADQAGAPAYVRGSLAETLIILALIIGILLTSR